MHFILWIMILSLMVPGFMGCRKQQETMAPSTPPSPTTTSGLANDQYIAIMSDLGCHNVIDETSGEGQAIFQKHGVTHDDIRGFRQKSDQQTMMAVAGEIAQKVAACH